MNNNFEMLLKRAYRNFKYSGKQQAKGVCPNEEDFACFIDGKMTESERDIFGKHILSCRECADRLRDHLLVLNKIDEKGMLEVPEGVREIAKSLVDEEVGQNVLDIILNFKEKAIELIRTTGDILLGPELVPVPVLRSRGEDEKISNEIKIVKFFGDIVTEVDVEKKRTDVADIIIRLTDKDKNKKISGIRVSLIKGDREIESSLTEDGKVKFEEVKTNKYNIGITKDEKKIGLINISIGISK